MSLFMQLQLRGPDAKTYASSKLLLVVPGTELCQTKKNIVYYLYLFLNIWISEGRIRAPCSVVFRIVLVSGISGTHLQG